ncbi:antibiotic biosynthesis monooxygenase [Geodermatophilus sp. SYSU D01176]
MDDAIAYIRDEVLPAVRAMDGNIGLSMLCDHDSGRSIVTSAWESEAAMRASAEQVRPMRERYTQMMGAQVEVHEWEIAVLHRVHEAPEGACTRVTWTRTDPARVDEVLDAYKMTLLPKLEDMGGFCSASLLVDRREGLGAGTVTLTDRQALADSRSIAQTNREHFTRAMGIDVLEVAEFELAVAHLRVPETV